MVSPSKINKSNSSKVFGITLPENSWFGKQSDSESFATDNYGGTRGGIASHRRYQSHEGFGKSDFRHFGSPSSSSSVSSMGSMNDSPSKQGKGVLKKSSRKPGRSNELLKEHENVGALSPVSTSPSLTGTDTESVTRRVTFLPAPLLVNLESEDDEPNDIFPIISQEASDEIERNTRTERSVENKISCGLNRSEPLNDDTSFHQKLPRSRSKDSPTTPRRKKVSAKEAYTAGFDYGDRSPGARKASVPKSAIGTTPPKFSPSSKDSNSPTKLHNSTNPVSFGMYDGDSESISSSCSWHVGIGKPEPLEKDASGDKDFLLPTVIMSSVLFEGKSKFSSSRSTVSLDENLISSFGTAAGAKTRARSLGVGTLGLPITPRLFSSDASVSSNCSGVSHHSGYSHYSEGSAGQDGRHGDSIARLIHASVGDDYSHAPPMSDFDDRSETGSIGSLSSYVSDLEEKVHGLERRIETLSAENARAKSEKLERRKKKTVTEIERRNKDLLMQDPSLCRLFILLLDPSRRKFELIQVLTNLLVATVGSVIQAIPENSTVPLMANQTYRALCRPKDGIEMSDASTPLGKVTGGWRVIRGEILIAIPQGYLGSECRKMAQPILHNPRLVSLLRRKDPLAPFAIKEISLPVQKDTADQNPKTTVTKSSSLRSTSRHAPKSNGRLRSKSLMSGQLQGAMLAARCSSSTSSDETSVVLDAMSQRRSSNLWSVHEEETAGDDELAKDVEPSSSMLAWQQLAQTSALCAENNELHQVPRPPTPRPNPLTKNQNERKQSSVEVSDYGPLKNERVSISNALSAHSASFANEAATQAFEARTSQISENGGPKDVEVLSKIANPCDTLITEKSESICITSVSSEKEAKEANTSPTRAIASEVEGASEGLDEVAKKESLLESSSEKASTRDTLKLECVTEEDEEVSSCTTEDVDDHVSMSSASWDKEVSRAAAERKEGDLVGNVINIVTEPDVSTKIVEKRKTPVRDSVLQNFLVSLSLLVVLRIIAKGLFGIEVTTSSAMGCKGIFFCVAMLKSMVHAQRGFEAHRATLEENDEFRKDRRRESLGQR